MEIKKLARDINRSFYFLKKILKKSLTYYVLIVRIKDETKYNKKEIKITSKEYPVNKKT